MEDNPYKSPQQADGGEHPVSEPAADPQLQPPKDLVKLTSFLNLSEAQFCQSVLRQEGIASFIENEGAVGVNMLWSNAVGGVKVLVASGQLAEAAALLEAADEANTPAGNSTPVTFQCEECGKEITFPAERRGKTETCPKCYEYVDVPD